MDLRLLCSISHEDRIVWIFALCCVVGVTFKNWWNLIVQYSIKLGWHGVGMHMIGQSRFFCDKGQTVGL
jgi:hypothetical protein